MAGNLSLKDFDKFKSQHESTTEWRMRKKFLIAFYNKYDEQRLICLSKIYSNVNILNCRYSKPLMEELDKLNDMLEHSYKQQVSQKSFKGGKKKKQPSDSVNKPIVEEKGSSATNSQKSKKMNGKATKPKTSSSSSSYPNSSPSLTSSNDT